MLYRSRGKNWIEKVLEVEVEVVNRSPKPPPEKVLEVWAREWFKEGHKMDLSKCPRAQASRTCLAVGLQSEHLHG